MNIVVFRERHPGEARVALVPSNVPALKKGGHEVFVEKSAGLLSGYTDEAYQAVGAGLFTDVEGMAGKADVVFMVRAAAADESKFLPVMAMKPGSALIAMLDPYQPDAVFVTLRDRQVSSFSLELIPRITRAQSMDVLSSMANLAGYKGVLLAASYMPKMFPMLMTAAGTVVPCKVFVLGAGVAGLQAIATARRLGAVVSAFDVRPAVREQVESLGAKFVSFDIGASEGSGGYAKELSAEQREKQLLLMNEYVKGIDVIIATAAIPGKPSPKLITRSMVTAMPKGSVIVDLASERGGNCELTQPGKVIVEDGVTIVGLTNLAASLGYHASQLYSKNLVNFLALIVDKEGKLTINREDEIVANCMVTYGGKAAQDRFTDLLGL